MESKGKMDNYLLGGVTHRSMTPFPFERAPRA